MSFGLSHALGSGCWETCQSGRKAIAKTSPLHRVGYPIILSSSLGKNNSSKPVLESAWSTFQFLSANINPKRDQIKNILKTNMRHNQFIVHTDQENLNFSFQNWISWFRWFLPNCVEWQGVVQIHYCLCNSLEKIDFLSSGGPTTIRRKVCGQWSPFKNIHTLLKCTSSV